MRTRVRGAGVVSCEYGEGVVVTAGNEVFFLDKPDEARAEHGGRGGKESATERVRRGERCGDL